MIRRSLSPPWTLWAYILWDLWRLILLTAAVLVTVIAFAAAVKPLADGRLGPVDTVRFMLFAMPPMLQYALPFAACFGATLAYHRLAADNEVVACHAGGISHRALVMPAFLTGLLLAGVLLVLSNRVIPVFLRHMATMISQDISKMIVHQVRSGEAVRMGSDKFLFADEVVSEGPDPSSGAFERLWIGGLLLVKLDKSGDVVAEASAREATVWLRRVDAADAVTGGGGGGAVTEVVIRPRDAVFHQRDKRGESAQTDQVFLIPNSFADDPKYLSGPDLAALRQHPERIEGIRRRHRELALTLAQREAVEELRAALRGPVGAVEFVDGLGQTDVLRAGDARPRRAAADPAARAAGPPPPRDANRLQVFPTQRGRPIIIEHTLTDGRVRTQRSNAAEIILPKASSAAASGSELRPVEGRAGGASPADRARVAMTLRLFEVSAHELDASGELIAPATGDEPADDRAAPGVINEWSLPDLTLAADPARQLLSMRTADLLAAAEARAKDRPIERPVVNTPMDELKARVQDLMREVLSKQQERIAMAIACLVMVLIGAVMAMRLRDSLPLTVYMWAFFPALAAVISISAGQQLTHGGGFAGLPLLWGGVGALGGYAAWEYARLVRH